MAIGKIPLEILRMIWTNLNRMDLLNTRLVCGSWNKESLRILQNSSYRIHLYNKSQSPVENSLEKFLEFAREFQFPTHQQFVMPFALHFKGGETLKGLNTFVSNVEALVHIFGETCVRNLEFWTFAQPKFCCESVLNLLTHISNGLDELTWQRGPLVPIQQTSANEQEILLKNHEQLQLTKLNRITLTSNSCGDNIWEFLIKKSPHIKEIKFEILNSQSQWEWPIYLSTNLVSKLKVKKFNEDSTSLLQKLKNQTGLYSAPLRTLELNLEIEKFISNPDELSRIGEFLTLFSSTLEKLILIFEGGYRDNENIGLYGVENLTFPFPSFPRLRYLKMTKTWRGNNVSFSLYNSDLFPALELLDVYYGLYLNFNNNRQELVPVFPSVQVLTLSINPGQQLILDCDKYMDKFSILFPQLLKISFVNEFTNAHSSIVRTSDGGAIKCFLAGLIKSNLAKTLEEIELVDWHGNYLGNALVQIAKGTRVTLENLPKDSSSLKDKIIEVLQRSTGFTDFEVVESKNDRDESSICIIQHHQSTRTEIFENLKKIKFWISPEGRRQLELTPLGHDDLNFAYLIPACPRLEEISISSFLLGQDSEAQTKVVDEISAEFPKINIRLMN